MTAKGGMPASQSSRGKMAKKTSLTIDDFKLDKENANQGNERGRKMLRHSLQTLGAGRSGLADADGNMIAGNQTLDEAKELGIPVRVIETNGDELVIVKRNDLHLYDENDTRARELAIADNRVGEANLTWNAEALAKYQLKGGDTAPYWFPTEINEIFDEATVGTPSEEDPDESEEEEPEREPEEKSYIVTIRCGSQEQQLDLVEQFQAEGLDATPVTI